MDASKDTNKDDNDDDGRRDIILEQYADYHLIYGVNKELYHTMSEEQHKAQGIVGILLMVQIGDTPNPELQIITSAINKVTYKDKHRSSTPIRHTSLRSLLPNTEQYMTYEGSSTHPGYWESTV
nr:carbonic anhydrase 1-like [Aedes albopictus]